MSDEIHVSSDHQKNNKSKLELNGKLSNKELLEVAKYLSQRKSREECKKIVARKRSPKLDIMKSLKRKRKRKRVQVVNLSSYSMQQQCIAPSADIALQFLNDQLNKKRISNHKTRSL